MNKRKDQPSLTARVRAAMADVGFISAVERLAGCIDDGTSIQPVQLIGAAVDMVKASRDLGSQLADVATEHAHGVAALRAEVERLRKALDATDTKLHMEIRRLRAALVQIASCEVVAAGDCVDIARRALKSGDDR